ncbi:Hypothetical predicted protein [Cloeon dipterum]|uniref:Uncharacterized protein n=1 Tax=Cloeon dipterum TaxID=197152 RepID=A0A8S1CUD8_9INSE|nr:Hypothetical predicted protein [Cloeon dipterum]
MQLNATKCVAMDISRARLPWTPQYTIGGNALDYVCTQRLLGVHISRDLCWNHHMSTSSRVKRMAYLLTLVKPKLIVLRDSGVAPLHQGKHREVEESLCGLTDYDAMARITEGRVHRGDDPLHLPVCFIFESSLFGMLHHPHERTVWRHSFLPSSRRM